MIQPEFYEVRLAGMETTSLSLAPKPKNFKGLKFTFEMAVNGKADANKSTLILTVIINIRDEGIEDILGHITVSFAYEIKEFAERIILNEEGIYVIPPDLEVQLRTISLSSTRGVMHSIFKSTYLSGATLPIIGQIPKLPLTKEEVKPS